MDFFERLAGLAQPETNAAQTGKRVI